MRQMSTNVQGAQECEPLLNLCDSESRSKDEPPALNPERIDCAKQSASDRSDDFDAATEKRTVTY